MHLPEDLAWPVERDGARNRCCTSSWRCSAASTGTATASACAGPSRWTPSQTLLVRAFAAMHERHASREA